ncbi:PREDICTED: PRUPE_6G029800 [Prunus dulcis]|uniref:PREDICTED: PRUPE_6G029800 n=1 Tax=Prunus dulcis TaxID=3755 RepID=A0A5E4ESU4_PRUDU|nr:PREDICTED: PRUPE_6G029800 [Prunus dulcis]
MTEGLIRPYICVLASITQVGAYIVGKWRPDMGIGAFEFKIVFAGGHENIFEGYKYQSCPSKDIYVFETEDPNNDTIKDPCDVFNNSTLQRGKSCPLVAQHDEKLYVLSTFCLKTWDEDLFRGGFEMFDPKVNGRLCPNPQLLDTFGSLVGLFV